MLRHYLLLSLKVFARRKFFTAISIFGISFTLVVLMVATAVLDHAFAPGTPELKQDRILVVGNALLYGPHMRQNSRAGFRLLDRYARGLPGVETLSLFSGNEDAASPVYLEGRKVECVLKNTDGAFWRVYDFTFLEGRPYTDAEFDGAQHVAVINRSTRRRLFGDAPAVGRAFEIAGNRFRVIGVVEDVSLLRIEPYADVWVPYSTQTSQAYRGQIVGDFMAAALARDQAGKQALREEFNSRMSRLGRNELGSDADVIVAPFETRFERLARTGPFRDPTDPQPQSWKLALAMLLAALLFSVIPVVNLVNLNVSRILERASEIGVRKAFGAPATTLVGQFVVENILLTLASAAVGLALSAFVLRLINASGLIPYSQFTVNLRVFAYGVLIAVAFGLLSGVYPAWRMSRLHPVAALKGASR